ncbi:MAG: hypothetical protein E5X86_22615 [Mesorhizobium sp.]|nr:MAG: hypothetical protein E5X86_22615 [Mesorhizobium sp.]
MTRHFWSTTPLSPFEVFERIGGFVVDFGFASLLEKFEEHYGKRAGKVLVGLIGMAVVAVCFGVIWQFISPIIGWATETAEGTSAVWFVWRAASAIVALVILAAGGAAVAAAIETKQLVRDAEEVLDGAFDIFEASTRSLERAKGLIDNVNSGAKIVDIDPDQSARLISDARATLTKMKKTKEKLKATHTRAHKSRGSKTDE